MDKLKTWDEKTVYSINELKNIFEEKWNKSLKVYGENELDEQNRTKFAIQLVEGELEAQLRSRGIKWTGYVIGIDMVRDQFSFHRREQAIKSGITTINEDGKKVFNDFDWRKGRSHRRFACRSL